MADHVGVIVGVLAAIAGLIDFLWGRIIRERPTAWLHMAGNLVALMLAVFNMLIHTRDAWDIRGANRADPVRTGGRLLIFTAWLGWALVYRHHVGVADETT